MASGPQGSILATLDVPVSTSATLAARDTNSTTQSSSQASAIRVVSPSSDVNESPLPESSFGHGQIQAVEEVTEVVDLSRKWEGCESLLGLGSDSRWAGATGALAGLLDISGSSPSGGSSSWHGVGGRMDVGGRGGGRIDAAACGAQNGLGRNGQVSTNAARLVVFWPSLSLKSSEATGSHTKRPFVHACLTDNATAAEDCSATSAAAESAAVEHRDSLQHVEQAVQGVEATNCTAVFEVSVPFLRPDILQVQGSLVIVSSSTGQACMQLCRVTSLGLQTLRAFSCSMDTTTGAAKCRLRGLALTQPCKAFSTSSGMSEPRSSQLRRSGQHVMVLLSRLEQPKQSPNTQGQEPSLNPGTGSCEGGLMLCTYPLAEASDYYKHHGTDASQERQGQSSLSMNGTLHHQASTISLQQLGNGTSAVKNLKQHSSADCIETSEKPTGTASVIAQAAYSSGGAGGGGSGGGQPGLMEQLAALVAGLQSHLDSRLDVMQGSINAHAARLAGIDSTLQQLKQ